MERRLELGALGVISGMGILVGYFSDLPILTMLSSVALATTAFMSWVDS